MLNHAPVKGVPASTAPHVITTSVLLNVDTASFLRTLLCYAFQSLFRCPQGFCLWVTVVEPNMEVRNPSHCIGDGSKIANESRAESINETSTLPIAGISCMPRHLVIVT